MLGNDRFTMPNSFIEKYMSYLTPEEWKILSYMAYRLFHNFQYKPDHIRMFHFCYVTGLKESAVKKALWRLIKIGLIICISENDNSDNGALWGIQLNESLIDADALENQSKGKG